MKIKPLILIVTLIVTPLIGCKNDDNTANTKEVGIFGIWNLKNVTGGLLGINIDYTTGEVIWDFKTNNRLFVENTIMTTGPEAIYSRLNTGTYTYEIRQEEGQENLRINDTIFGYLLHSKLSLQLDDGIAADGFITTFER